MNKLSITDQDLIDMSTCIAETIHPEQIVLFGSHARSEAGVDSDVDLLVITSETYGPHNSRRKVLARVLKALSKIRFSVDIILSSVEEVDKWQDTTNHLIAHAVREGRVLYERH